MLNKVVIWGPIALYYALVSYLSAQSDLGQVMPFLFYDKAMHTIEYAALGFLLMRAVMHTWRAWPVYRGFILVMVAIALLGAIDEYHQAFVPNRESSGWDLFADVLGGALGAFGYWQSRAAFSRLCAKWFS